MTHYLLVLPLFIITAFSMFAQNSLRITWSKSFPGSTPAFAEIALDGSGAGTYREDPKDEDPVKFQLSETEWSQITSLARKLDNFAHPLESGLKIANMGIKTLRYEGPDGAHEVKFNYSEDADARGLNDLFEQAMETERAFIELERCVRFDKLGAQNAILRIGVLRDRKALLAQGQFLPLLDRVTKNESFLHIARDRAAALADDIRKTDLRNGK